MAANIIEKFVTVVHLELVHFSVMSIAVWHRGKDADDVHGVLCAATDFYSFAR